MHYVCVCICVLVHLLGKSSGESAVIQNGENSPQSSGDVIMREDAEEKFYNIDLKKYDGIRCSDPEPPENGAIVGEGNQVGSVVYVECRKGYRLNGPEVMSCVPVADGAQWDPLVSRTCLEAEKAPETETTKEATAPEDHEMHSQPYFNPRPPVLRHRHHNVESLKEEPTSEGVNLLPPFCLDKPDVGPCRALFKRYYFSKATMECQTFTYGGCHGNKNNFRTVADCNMACLAHQ